MDSAGRRLRQAIKAESPLQVVGTINAYTAIMAESVGYQAIYLSGAGGRECLIWYAGPWYDIA